MIKLDFLLSGAFDPIIPLADICEKYNMWLHVDVSGAQSSTREFMCVCSISNALIRSPFIGCLGRWSPALQQAKTQTRRHRESQIRDLEPAQADVHLAAVLYGAFQRERRIRFKSFQIISNPIFHFKSKPTYSISLIRINQKIYIIIV